MLPHDMTKGLGHSDGERMESQIDWMAHLEALPLATWIGDPDGRNVFVNRAYRQMLGVLHLDEVADRAWAQHVYPADRVHYASAWNRFVEGQSARFKATVRWVRPDTGATIKIAVRAQKLQCGQFQGWIRLAAMEQALSKLEELAYVRT